MSHHAYADASAALGIACRQGAGKLRHININMLWANHRSIDGDINFKTVWGATSPADSMTKYNLWPTMERHLKVLNAIFRNEVMSSEVSRGCATMSSEVSRGIGMSGQMLGRKAEDDCQLTALLCMCISLCVTVLLQGGGGRRVMLIFLRLTCVIDDIDRNFFVRSCFGTS